MVDVGDSGLIYKYPVDLDVSPGISSVAAVLYELPLVDAVVIGDILQVTLNSVYFRLKELKRLGFAGSVSLSWSKGRIQRWWLTDDALDGVMDPGLSWHGEGGRSQLIEVLPMVEWFYYVVSLETRLGHLEKFSWFSGMSFEAAARYDSGAWVLFIWTGLWETEKNIGDRFEKLSLDLRELSVLGGRALPSQICVIASDGWQRELVYRAASDYSFGNRLVVWSLFDGSRSGSLEVPPGVGWVDQSPILREVGDWSWDSRIESSLWSRENGFSVGKMLNGIAEWPGMQVPLARAILGEGVGGKKASRAINKLRSAGVVQSFSPLKKARFGLTKRGVAMVARRDRVSFGESVSRSFAGDWDNRDRLRLHEDGLMDLCRQFVEVGAEFAAGWRSWEFVSGRGGIVPDGMVQLREGPYGPGWHYVEYERSAAGRARILKKLWGFLSEGRRDRWPLLVVAKSDNAERVFQEVGMEGGIGMITTTMQRLSRYGAVGNKDCWNCYGEAVEIS